jgi:type I restriction-modification system DNA methylase subunit
LQGGNSINYLNTGLFVDYFLKEKLPQERLWQNTLADLKTKQLFVAVKRLYVSKKDSLPQLNEAQLEEEFIRPIFDLLGFSYIVQAPTKAYGRSLAPDYALFADEAAKKAGYAQIKQNNYANVLAIADAKYWERPLDKRLRDSRDIIPSQNPTFQISSYFTATKAKWAILTNGRYWRLYSREHSQTMGEYYQVDLVSILEAGDLSEFLYFYLFFRCQAFQPEPVESFLDKAIQQSINYGAKVQDNLKKDIFTKIFIHLAKGFANWRRQNGEKETPETLKVVFDNTLILLYRLLFVLYAESRDLLPVKEKDCYYTKSLDKIKREIKQDIEKNRSLSKVSTDYWDDLVNLFHIIDVGDPILNVPKYNGGLFSSTHRFLEENKIPDYYLAEALYGLTVHASEETNWNDVFIDYRSLGVKQLGSIYEGLLEFHLNVADQELAVVKEKGREKYVSVNKIKKSQRDTGVRVKPGELYLENTKAERKATGSYYTPDYIVKYIVENTVGPLIDQLEQDFQAKIKELKSKPKYKGRTAKWKTAKLKEFDPALRVLELKVCDPAMGSGHFLVATVDYISSRIYDILNKYSEQSYFGKEAYESSVFNQIHEIRQNILKEMERQQVTIDNEKLEDDKVIIRRMVMKRCIFGVDLNYLAVELAKLSLWLNSFTVGAPLSFLDHHLRWGNSLIGSTVEEVEREMQKSLFGSQFIGLISATDAMIKVGKLTDSTFAELQESQKDYSRAISLLEPYKKVLDVWTSQYFGNNGAKDLIDQGKIDPDNLKAMAELLDAQEKAVVTTAQLIQQKKRFFHWELEFPEVFYDYNGRKENPGFDVVIGNPPWGQKAAYLEARERAYLQRKYPSTQGILDLFRPFCELSFNVLRFYGLWGMVLPDIVLLKNYPKTRKLLLDGFLMQKIDVWGMAFSEAVIDVATILGVRKQYVEEGESNIILAGQHRAQHSITSAKVPQSLFGRLTGYKFNLFLKLESALLLEKLDLLPKYHELFETHEGIHSGNIRDKLFLDAPNTPECKKLIFGRNEIGRYKLEWGGKWVNYDYGVVDKEQSDYANLGRMGWFISPKLLLRRTGDYLVCMFDKEQFFVSNNIFVSLPRTASRINLLTVLSYLNSSLITWYYQTIQPRRGKVFAELKINQINQFPIANISFTTPPEERQKKVEKAKQLYFEAIKKGI